jgi:hypothetical protein
MPLTLKEIEKLPPRLRFQKLREFEAEQKKKREEEEKKLRQEEEELVKKSIEEITREELEEEEEEKKLKEEKKKPEETLEQIAEEAKKPEGRQLPEYQARKQFEYISELAKQPISETLNILRELDERRLERGYWTPNEQRMFQNRAEAVYQKEQSGYVGSEVARNLMSEADKLIGSGRDLLKQIRAYK